MATSYCYCLQLYLLSLQFSKYIRHLTLVSIYLCSVDSYVEYLPQIVSDLLFMYFSTLSFFPPCLIPLNTSWFTLLFNFTEIVIVVAFLISLLIDSSMALEDSNYLGSIVSWRSMFSSFRCYLILRMPCTIFPGLKQIPSSESISCIFNLFPVLFGYMLLIFLHIIPVSLMELLEFLITSTATCFSLVMIVIVPLEFTLHVQNLQEFLLVVVALFAAGIIFDFSTPDSSLFLELSITTLLRFSRRFYTVFLSSTLIQPPFVRMFFGA